ncbi:hypothetical protein PanWU01x14_249960 [Parasponia andersonii]|uniref:Uncharacterized protein n=1 Tax=Parasponia andersonii TaxID=3476 RepID=A0A2P5BD38_PARAD|nr:hypothetical protein PanWU01x14_249960 [Parasponia andersonii]
MGPPLGWTHNGLPLQLSSHTPGHQSLLLGKTSLSRMKVEDVPHLTPVLELNEHFACKISTKYNLALTVKCIKDALKNDPEDLQLFKEPSLFGHFLDVPNHYEHLSQVIWLLLIRQARCEGSVTWEDETMANDAHTDIGVTSYDEATARHVLRLSLS